MLELQLAALRCGAAWDPAGRLLFPDHRPAIAYAHAVAVNRRARQKVHRLHATPLQGYTWPASDRRAATITDLRILMARGLNVTDAAHTLGIPPSTAYRWLGIQ